MTTLSLASLAKSMREMDICMFTTLTPRGGLNSRPMSNNKDVTWKGDSYFFTFEKSKKIKELEANPKVLLNFEGKSDLYMNVAGKATLIRNKQAFAEHWVPDLDKWFEDGIDTKGLVLIHVKGTKIHYWQKEREGEIKIGRKAN